LRRRRRLRDIDAVTDDRFVSVGTGIVTDDRFVSVGPGIVTDDRFVSVGTGIGAVAAVAVAVADASSSSFGAILFVLFVGSTIVSCDQFNSIGTTWRSMEVLQLLFCI